MCESRLSRFAHWLFHARKDSWRARELSDICLVCTTIVITEILKAKCTNRLTGNTDELAIERRHG